MRIHLTNIATQTLVTNEATPISQFSCVYGRLVEIIAKRADLVITVSHPIPAQILITRITLGSDYVCLDSSDLRRRPGQGKALAQLLSTEYSDPESP
jgi:hypothetical protein